MVIRPAREEDLVACGEIYATAFAAPPYHEEWSPTDAAEMLGELLRKDAENCWCLEEDGKVAGFAFCTVYGRFRASIQEFAIHPSYQKKGLGKSLMDHVLADLRRKNTRIVDLVVNQKAPAFSLYRKFGFRQPKPYVLMAKQL